MDSKSKLDQGASGQIDRFKEAARALKCDEDEAAFDKKLRGIASRRPKPEKSTKEPE